MPSYASGRSIPSMSLQRHASETERGTKKLLAQYGDRLVRVRYRYDEQGGKRVKKVELVVEEIPWDPGMVTPSHGDASGGKRIEKRRRSSIQTPTGLYDKAQGKRVARHPGSRDATTPNPNGVVYLRRLHALTTCVDR